MNHREKEKLFKTLFDAYYERLYYAAATILGDQMVAEDIIEDVFELLLSAKTSSLACTCMHAHASLEK